jgi:hypothetical protein
MMAESKFTSGPYRVNDPLKSPNRELWVYSGKTYLGTVDNCNMDPEEIAANAELWADAPRLLEALRTLHDFALPLKDRGLAAESEQAFADARALLEKHGG